MSTKNVNNIKAVYQLATIQEKIDGVRWYQSAHDAAMVMARTYGLTLQTCAGVIAALSPRNKWTRNLIDAENLIEAFVRDPNSADKIKVCTFSSNKQKALKILLNHQDFFTDTTRDILKGPKLIEFFNCILGVKEDVTIDGHAYCIWNGSRTSLKDVPNIGVKLRKEIKEDFRKAAKKLGCSASECQAVTWCAWRRIHGVTA
jgi:hypothetical protein